MTSIAMKQRTIWAALFEVYPHDRNELPGFVWLAGYAADQAEFIANADVALADDGYQRVDMEDCHALAEDLNRSPFDLADLTPALRDEPEGTIAFDELHFFEWPQ